MIFDEVARLHEKTVQEYGTGQKQFIVGKRMQKRIKRLPVSITKIDELLWETAWQLCSNDISRIEVINEREVIIHNNGNWKVQRLNPPSWKYCNEE